MSNGDLQRMVTDELRFDPKVDSAPDLDVVLLWRR
jgi:hypothetical protein